jgi:hypothetical protein
VPRISTTGNPQKTLYLASSSEEELATLTQSLAERLRKDAQPHLKLQYVPMPQETHATIYHPAALQAFRRLFMPGSADR